MSIDKVRNHDGVSGTFPIRCIYTISYMIVDHHSRIV